MKPHAGLEKNGDSKLDSDKDLKRPMMSYKITDDEINWKKETDTETQLHQLQRKTNYGVNMIGVLKARLMPHYDTI